MSDLLDMKYFWNKTAKKFGGKDDYTAVLIPSSKGLWNWYVNFIQRTAVEGNLQHLSGKTVLDLGCGVGRWSARLAIGNKRVIGIDLSREMVKHAKKQIAKKKLLNVEFVVASAQNLPFAPEIFDATLSVTVLQHIVDNVAFRSATSEMVRTLKSKGQIILLEFMNNEFDNFNPQFPTISHDYEEAFKIDKKLKLMEVRGVDLSLFLKPLNGIIKKHGRYLDQLEGHSVSNTYVFLSQFFYFLSSLACVFSVPFDLAFRDVFLKYTEHKINVFRR